MASLDLQTKARIRRQLGVPFAGRADANTTMGLRTVLKAGQLEFYTNNLQMPEVSLLLGRPYGAFIIYAPTALDRVYSFTVDSTTVTYTVQPSDMAARDPLLSVATGILAAIQAALPTYLADSAQIAVIGSYPQLSTAIQFELLTPTATPFALTAVSNVVVIQSGDYPASPQFLVDDGNGDPTKQVIAYGLLPICEALEQQLLNSSSNLSLSEVGSRTLGAAVFRPDELRVRNSLLRRYRFELGVALSFFAPNPSSGIPSFGLPQ